MPAASPVFISYSINYEDVILNRLFGSRDSGFYVDVGAAQPMFDNDTKALYDRGWRGINIEPNAAFYRELLAQRPGDHNVNVAVSDTPGQLIFHEVVGTGLSTCDAEEAERAAAKGFEVVRHTTEAVPLRQILEAAAAPEIDLLKVDVEGFEMKALASNDWRRFRPKVILVEATFPDTPRRRPDVITPYLAEQGYRRIYFDGLNDYYIERDFAPPPEAFERPPNVFDHFERYELHALKQEHENSKTCIASLRDALAERSRACVEVEKQLRLATLAAEASAVDVDNARAELRAMHARCHAFTAQLERVYRSKSWRITRPLRGLAHALGILRGRPAA
jgi:FkbM family methyltransferase